MVDEQDQLAKKRDELLRNIADEIKVTHKRARGFELAILGVRLVLWGSMGANFLLGVFSPQIPTKILAPALPILSSLMGSAYYFLGNMSWREKSNAYYAARDRLRGLERRLKYEQSTPKPDGIAAVSSEYGRILNDCGGRLSAANNREDQRIGKGKPQPES